MERYAQSRSLALEWQEELARFDGECAHPLFSSLRRYAAPVAFDRPTSDSLLDAEEEVGDGNCGRRSEARVAGRQLRETGVAVAGAGSIAELGQPLHRRGHAPSYRA